MNTHLSLDTERDRRLAETLKSLTLEATTEDSEPPKKSSWRFVHLACLCVLVATTASGVILYRPDAVYDIKDVVAALWKPARPVDDSVSGPVDVKLLPGESPAEQSIDRRQVPIAREITASGFVVAPRSTTVFSKYEGEITDVAVEVGDTVTAGQQLIRLEDSGAHFALEQAEMAKATNEIALAGRIIDLAQASASVARAEALSARDAVSQQALEQARTIREQASNAVAQARQAVTGSELSIRIAEERLAELTVRAPFGGTVTRLEAHVGDTVLARLDSVRESQSLLTITDLSTLAVDADAAETNVAFLKPGLHGQAVLDGFPDKPFGIEIAHLAPVASVEKGTITLRLSLTDPPEGIRPNMAARIQIALDETGDTPK